MIRAVYTFILFVLTYLYASASIDKIGALEKELASVSDTVRVNTLLEISKLYLRKNGQVADSVAFVAYQYAAEINHLPGKIKSIIYLGNIKSFNGQSQQGDSLCRLAISLCDSIANEYLLSESYNLLYLLHYRKGSYDSATIAAKKSLVLAMQSKNQNMLARGHQNMGILSSITGKHTEAIKHFLLSEKHYKELGDEFALALLLGNLGVTFEEAGNYPKALEYMRKQLEYAEVLDDDFLRGNCLVNIGAVFSLLGEPDSAIIYYERSYSYARAAQNFDLMIINLDNIGSYYSNIKEYDKASFHLISAYNMALEHGFEYQNVYVNGHLAQNYIEQQKYDSALVYAQKQLNLALEYEFLYDQSLAYKNLSVIYAAQNNFQKAYDAQKQYVIVNDSLFSQEKSGQIEALREEYESEKKEQEIENLKAKNEAARYRNISYAGAAISFLALGGFLYYLQRQRIKRNQMLLEKEKELDRMKSRFFANISHEFRTPLTLILGPIDDLMTKIDQSNIKKQLQVMKRNAGRLLDLVNQLLDLSKIESGKLKLNASASDIMAVTKGVAMSFHSIAEQKNIELIMNVRPDEIFINYDKAKWETILTNLLSNAFKFTPENGRISIESELIKKKDHEYLRFAVSDSGNGIPKNEVAQIFNRFYQADSNQLLQHEGSGIGLALTKELIELHQGTITVESDDGEGTRFIVEMPINLPPSHSTIEQKKNETHAIPIADPLESTLLIDEKNHADDNQQLVLVIEDHEDVSNYIKETLSGAYAVISAMDGEEGIEVAIDRIPDLIISDVMMPKKDGYEVCHALKNNEKTSHIPIILLTAKSGSEDKIAGLKTRADDYVTKPFVPRELLARIENLLESRKSLRAKYQQEGVVRPKELAVNSMDEQFLNRLIELVEHHLSTETFGVEQLGEELGMSRSQLHRKLKATLGHGPNQFIRSFRLQRAHDLLKQGAATASEISYQVGFSSPSYFTKCFHEQFGYTPSEIPM